MRGGRLLLGIGARLWVSLKKIIDDEFLDEKFSHSSPTTPKTTPLFRAPNPALQFDWRRFWSLFSSETELSSDEKLELARLKTQLHNLHLEMQKEEKRKNDELHRAIQSRLRQLGMNEEPNAYIIQRGDYKRGSEKEREYLRLHKNFLYRIYDNRCSKCGNDTNGLDIDHFFISKNEGGCFQMQHRDGFVVNNAIPLCETCNRSKSDKNYRSFFSQYDLLRILERNAKMNERLNQTKIAVVRTKAFAERSGEVLDVDATTY